MFVGHYSAAIAAKSASPKVPFWLLILAAQFVDIFWGLFIATGVEKLRLDPTLASNHLDLYYMPFTHSIAGTVFWMVTAFAIVKFLPFKLTAKQCMVVAVVVGSHWLLDLFVHRPDLLVFDGHKVGFGLWDMPAVALALELGLVIVSLGYLCMRPAFTRQTKRNMAIFALLLIVIQLAMVLGAQPSNISIMLGSMITVFFGLAAAAYFVDKNQP